MLRLTRLLLLFAVMTPVTATPLLCLWDHDTLAQEQARFPGTLELLTGRFPRHSDAYYRWRIVDRGERLEENKDDPRLWDDLAVAWSKLHEDARAVELMEQKEARFPGLYETAANLGTFHIHAGQFEQGARHIERAIEINPDAHFGREVYQLLLVQYVLAQRAESKTTSLPLQPEALAFHGSRKGLGFWGFVERERNVTEENRVAEIALAVKGVLGMMRFGNHESPILCEALSDLLLANYKTDAKNLAARALLQASYSVEDPQQRELYRKKAGAALMMQTPDGSSPRSIELAEVEALYRSELAEAATWWAAIEKDELGWIANEENVDERFREKYYGAVAPAVGGGWLTPLRQNQIFLGLGATLLALVLVRRRARLAAAGAT